MPSSVHPPLGALPPRVPRDISQHSNIFYLGRLDEIKIQSLPLPQFVKDAGSRINSLHLPNREIFPKWSRSKYFVFMLITPDLPQLGGTELEFPNNLAFCFCLLRGVKRELTVADRWKSPCFLVCDKLWTRLLSASRLHTSPVSHILAKLKLIKYGIYHIVPGSKLLISVAPQWRYPIINPRHVIAPWELKVFDGSEKSN